MCEPRPEEFKGAVKNAIDGIMPHLVKVRDELDQGISSISMNAKVENDFIQTLLESSQDSQSKYKKVADLCRKFLGNGKQQAKVNPALSKI